MKRDRSSELNVKPDFRNWRGIFEFSVDFRGVERCKWLEMNVREAAGFEKCV